jgi:hypothetical protein
MDTTFSMKVGTPASTDPREFLAMRARQKKTRARMRRLKVGLVSGMLAGLLAGGLLFPRWRRPVETPQAQAAVAAPVAPAPAPALEAPATPAPEPAAPAQPAAAAPAAESSATECEESFAHGQWRAAITSCTAAFEAEPGQALAMKVAHAHFSHGAAIEAGEWAQKAVSLETTDADAFVLIGHAERRAGHPEQALAAYRRYLRLAPAGWHAQRVRVAIRELKAAIEKMAAPAAE